MVETPDTIRKYLTALKERTGLSWADLSAATKLPDSTIRKIFSGETADPRLETISLIVSAMGGSLDAMLRGQTETESAETAVLSMMRESYENRIADMKRTFDQYTQSMRKDKILLFITACGLTAFLIVFLVMDLLLGLSGWIRY